MKTVSMKIGAVLAMALATAGVARAADMSAPVPYQDDERNGVKIGMLECDVGGGLGYVIGSAKEVACTFRSTKGRVETYTGNIKKLGVDIGWTRQGKIVWAVFAPVAGAWGLKGWTLVTLDKIDAATLGHAMQMAWRNVAPKSLP